MELLYIWIEDYKNIHHQGFNFSPKYRFDFDFQNKKLTYEEFENNLPDNFFGENITNITAIVGENGSGKSSLIEFLMGTMFPKGLIRYSFFIIIDKEVICNKIKIEFSPKYSLKLVHHNKIKDIEAIFYSSVIDIKRIQNFESLNHNDFLHDISLNNFFDNILNSEKKAKSKYGNYTNQEIRNQLSIFNNKKIGKFLKSIKIPNELYLEIKFYKIKGIISESVGFNDLFYCLIIDNYLKIEEKYLKEFVKEYKNDPKNIKSIVEKIFFDKKDEKVLNFFNILKNNIKQIEYKREVNDGNLISDYIITINDKLIEIINNYYDIEFTDNLDFDWYNMSTGEKAMLNIFSRFYLISKDIKSYNIIILIDEGELFLHPQWQKELIKNLINGFKEIFNNKNIQIILTSHSPFVCSDLPKENIIFLDKFDEKDIEVKNKIQEVCNCKVIEPKDMKQTFGQNIHTLLSNSFFLEDGLIGEFAKEKIKYVINILNDKVNEHFDKKDKCFKIINLIGEDFIREKLLEMFNNKYNKQKSKEEQIKELEEQIKKLKKKFND